MSVPPDGSNVPLLTKPDASSLASSPFAGRSYVVTGAASPVGRALCQLLAAQGANLAITDSSKGDGQELCLELQKAGNGGSLLFAVVGHDDSDKLAAFVRNASKTLKRLDGLVNCAFTLHEEAMLHLNKADTCRNIMDATYSLSAKAMQAIIAIFELQNDAKLQHPQGGYPIVNIVSNWDVREYCSTYEAARHALNGLTRASACEYATSDIRVNLIQSGALEDSDPAQTFVNQIFTAIGTVKTQIPMRRLARADEVAKTAMFLLSPDSSYITGAVIPVDGGISAKRG